MGPSRVSRQESWVLLQRPELTVTLSPDPGDVVTPHLLEPWAPEAARGVLAGCGGLAEAVIVADCGVWGAFLSPQTYRKHTRTAVGCVLYSPVSVFARARGHENIFSSCWFPRPGPGGQGFPVTYTRLRPAGRAPCRVWPRAGRDCHLPKVARSSLIKDL